MQFSSDNPVADYASDWGDRVEENNVPVLGNRFPIMSLSNLQTPDATEVEGGVPVLWSANCEPELCYGGHGDLCRRKGTTRQAREESKENTHGEESTHRGYRVDGQ